MQSKLHCDDMNSDGSPSYRIVSSALISRMHDCNGLSIYFKLQLYTLFQYNNNNIIVLLCILQLYMCMLHLLHPPIRYVDFAII